MWLYERIQFNYLASIEQRGFGEMTICLGFLSKRARGVHLSRYKMTRNPRWSSNNEARQL